MFYRILSFRKKIELIYIEINYVKSKKYFKYYNCVDAFLGGGRPFL